MDCFGNYLFQKILERIIPDERVVLLQSVSTRFVDACLNKFGKLSVQKIVKVCAIENKKTSKEEATCDHTVARILTYAIKPAAARLCFDKYAYSSQTSLSVHSVHL